MKNPFMVYLIFQHISQLEFNSLQVYLFSFVILIYMENDQLYLNYETYRSHGSVLKDKVIIIISRVLACCLSLIVCDFQLPLINNNNNL